MIKSKILVTLLCCSVFVASCSMQQNSTSHNSNNTLQPSQLSSSTGTSTLNQGVNGEIQTVDLDIVKPKLSMSYHFLNSEKVAYETSTFGDLIKPYKYTVVYFYPKDGTPNCTIQALDFSAMKEKFASYNTQVIGVSKDDLESHKAFAQRNELTIPLLQDVNSELLKQFGALGPLQEYGNGKELSDILRSTYIIDNQGKAFRAFKDVQAVGHAERVLSVIKTLP